MGTYSEGHLAADLRQAMLVGDLDYPESVQLQPGVSGTSHTEDIVVSQAQPTATVPLRTGLDPLDGLAAAHSLPCLNTADVVMDFTSELGGIHTVQVAPEVLADRRDEDWQATPANKIDSTVIRN